jgi:insulinase (Peptidase family M16)
MKRLALLALLAACAGSQKETASAARSGAAPAETPPAPVVAAAPGGAADAGVAAPTGAPAQPGKEAQKHGEQGAIPPPASATAQAQPGGEAQPSAPEPPLMPDAPFRAQVPAPLAVQPHFEPPVPVQRKLKNGARVLIVENHSVPLVAVDVRFLHGVDADPGDKPGLAEFVADTVDEGTKSRPAAKLAEEIEDLAASLGAGASLETSSVHLNCLTETLPKALDLLADVVQNPAFRTWSACGCSSSPRWSRRRPAPARWQRTRRRASSTVPRIRGGSRPAAPPRRWPPSRRRTWPPFTTDGGCPTMRSSRCPAT